jgi:hypothetical protein
VTKRVNDAREYAVPHHRAINREVWAERRCPLTHQLLTETKRSENVMTKSKKQEEVIAAGDTEATEQECIQNHAPVNDEHVVDDEAVKAVEVQFVRNVLDSVYDRRRSNPPTNGGKETPDDFEVRAAWWNRAQEVLKAVSDVNDDELLMKFAQGIVTYTDYNQANNLIRAIMSGMTFQYRGLTQGKVQAQQEALAKAKQLAGDSSVDSAIDALFADDGREPYANQDEYYANLTPEVAAYITEQFHALFSRVLARMYQADADNARKNNAPRPYNFESLPFTSLNVDGDFVGMMSLTDAMQGLDKLEGERAGNAKSILADAPAIVL